MVAISAVPSLLVFAAFVGLGMHRNATSLLIVVSASALVWGPSTAVAMAVSARKGLVFGVSSLAWSLFLFAIVPVYFPQERVDAIASGLGVMRLGPGWQQVARGVAESLPADPNVARSSAPEALAVVQVELPVATPLLDSQIALPFEGEGRRLAVPVVFEHGAISIETWMLLDTGATYTTLSADLMRQLGVAPGPDAPVLTLHTANGERQAAVTVTDRVWLGDLVLEGVALAQCDACARGEISGLLGLNVSGGYNLTIDADRREVVFSQRAARQQKLDVGPFVEVGARFTRYGGGRIEVEVTVSNKGPRTVQRAIGEVSCEAGAWSVEVVNIPPGTTRSSIQRLPAHSHCDSYKIGLSDAVW